MHDFPSCSVLRAVEDAVVRGAEGELILLALGWSHRLSWRDGVQGRERGSGMTASHRSRRSRGSLFLFWL